MCAGTIPPNGWLSRALLNPAREPSRCHASLRANDGVAGGPGVNRPRPLRAHNFFFAYEHPSVSNALGVSGRGPG